MTARNAKKKIIVKSRQKKNKSQKPDSLEMKIYIPKSTRH